MSAFETSQGESKQEGAKINENIPKDSSEEKGKEAASVVEKETLLEDINASLREMKIKGREDTPEAARLKEAIKEIENPIQDEEFEDSLGEKREKDKEEIPSLWHKNNSAKILKDEDGEIRKLTEDQEKEDAKKLNMARENMKRFTSNIPTGEQDPKIEPVSGGEKEKGAEKPGDTDTEESKASKEKEPQRNRPSLKTAENLSKQSEKLFELLNSEEGKNMSAKQREKMDREIRVLKEREAMAIASALTSESVYNARKTIRDNMSLEELSELALGTKRSVEALQAAVMAQIEENRLSNEEKGVLRKIDGLIGGRFGQSKEKETEVPKYGKNKWKMTSYEEGVVWDALKGGKEDKKQKELALKLLLRGTGRESYYDEIIKDANAEYEASLLNSGNIRLDVNWKDEEGKERELQFVVDFAVDGEKGGEPNIMLKGMLGMFKRHSVEIETTEKEFLPPVDSESAKEIKTNYPKTAGFIESYRKIFGGDRDGLREINEAENFLKDGNKEGAVDDIAHLSGLIKKGLGRNMWSGQEDKKNAEDLVKSAEEAVEELKKEEVAGNAEDEPEYETEEEIVTELDLSTIEMGDIVIATKVADDGFLRVKRLDTGKLQGTAFASDGTQQGGNFEFPSSSKIDNGSGFVEIKIIRKKKKENSSEDVEWEKRKGDLVKKYPELEKITTANQIERRKFVVNAFLESLDKEQLATMDERLEKRNASYFISFKESRNVGNSEVVEMNFMKKVTAGKWEESNKQDLADIKKLLWERIAVEIEGQDVKNFMEKKRGEEGAGGEGEQTKAEINFKEGVWKEYPKTATFGKAMLEFTGYDKRTFSAIKETEIALGKGDREKVIKYVKEVVGDMEVYMRLDVGNSSGDDKKLAGKVINTAGGAIEELKKRENEGKEGEGGGKSLVEKYPKLEDFKKFISGAGTSGRYHLMPDEFFKLLDGEELEYLKKYLDERGNKLEFKKNETCFGKASVEDKFINYITGGEWGRGKKSGRDLTDIRGLAESLLDGRDIGDYQLPSRGVNNKEAVKNAETIEPEEPKRMGEEDVVTERVFSKAIGNIKPGGFKPEQKGKAEKEKEEKPSTLEKYVENLKISEIEDGDIVMIKSKNSDSFILERSSEDGKVYITRDLYPTLKGYFGANFEGKKFPMEEDASLDKGTTGDRVVPLIISKIEEIKIRKTQEKQ